MATSDKMLGVILRLAVLALAVLSTGHCYCPKVHQLGYCAFRIHCNGAIRGVTLPKACQNSDTHPVTVELTLNEAVERFDENMLENDREFLETISTFRASAVWPQTSLSFLNYMPRLRHLILTNNHMESVDGEPFYNLKYLQHVDMSRNALTAIEDLFTFEGPNQLKRLLLSYNEIEEIPGDAFSELISLKELDLSHNKISDLTEEPFLNLTNLEVLRLDHNRIKNLNGAVNSLENLKHLYLRGNQIQNIDEPSLKILNHLETFDVSRNQLDKLKPIVFLRHWQHFGGVCKIILSENNIESIPNGTLKELSSRFTREATLHTVDILTELDLSKNKINKIEFNAFQTIIKLIKLDLSCNRLSDFVVNTNDLRDLKYLNLSSNLISNLLFDSFSSMTNLQNLDLSHNKLNFIPQETFTNNYNLMHVNMTFNEIASLKRLNIKIFHPEGGVLDLSNNYLTQVGIQIGEGCRLTILVLNSNNISDAESVNLINQNELKTLEIKRNFIRKLNIKSLRLPITLTTLDLSYNAIEEIGPSTFHRVAHLNSLFLGHNRLTNIEYGVFQGLIELNNLDLSFNAIKYLDSKVLMDLKSLSVLSLRSNGLYYLDYKSWYGHRSNLKVFLDDNNLTCDWLGNALNDFNNGYTKMRPTVRQPRLVNSNNTVEGIPCNSESNKEEKSQKILDKSSNYVLADDRLLITNKKILEAVKEQNDFLMLFMSHMNNTISKY